MKKFVSLMMVLFVGATLTIGQQMSNTEIMQMIWRSAEFQRGSGITNPDLIFPGQVLTYSFTDGATETIAVQRGDNQWTIVRDKLSKLVSLHGPVVDKQIPPVVEPPVEKRGMPEWLRTLIIALAILVLFFCLYVIALVLTKLSNRKKNSKIVDPTIAGEPVVQGGVNAENAANHFRDLHPGQNVLVKDVKPGFLSTPNGKIARVGFANRTHQNLAFRNVPGFKGKVSTNNGLTWTKEYFLQPCGNPAKARNSYTTGIIFSESPINFGDENDVAEPVKAPVTPAMETISASIKPEIDSDDDIAVVSGDQALVAEEFLKTQKAHKVTMVYERWGDGRVKIESVFETKNLSDSKTGQKPSGKKE